MADYTIGLDNEPEKFFASYLQLIRKHHLDLEIEFNKLCEITIRVYSTVKGKRYGFSVMHDDQNIAFFYANKQLCKFAEMIQGSPEQDVTT